MPEKETLERARKDLERTARLAPSGASSRSEHEAATATYERFQGQGQAARARLKLLEAGTRPEEIAEAEAELARATAQQFIGKYRSFPTSESLRLWIHPPVA